MKVTIKLHGLLRKYRPSDLPGSRHQPFELIIQDGTRVDTMIESLGIDLGMVAGKAVNGEAVIDNVKLKAADQINLFPPAAGG